MDDGLFEAMWQEHYGPVARSAYLVVGDVEEAADIAQEAFARALQRWKTVQQLERPRAWVSKVAMNLALSRRRALGRGFRGFPERGAIDPPEPPHDDLTDAIRSLTQAQRAVVATCTIPMK